LLERYDLDSKLALVLLNRVLCVIGAVEIDTLRVLARSGMITSNNEVGSTVILADNGVPNGFARTTHAHGEGQQTDDSHAIGVSWKERLVDADTGKVVDVSRLCETDNWVDQDIGLTGASGTDSELSVGSVHGVPRLRQSCPISHHFTRCTLSGKQRLGTSRACRSVDGVLRGSIEAQRSRSASIDQWPRSFHQRSNPLSARKGT
jgi:hypothetical protein